MRICDKFSIDADRAIALSRLHAEREIELRSYERVFRLKSWRTIVVAIGAFLASQLPKESFEVLHLGDAYGWYRLFLFGGLVFLFVYLLLLDNLTEAVFKSPVMPSPDARAAIRLVLLHCELSRFFAPATERHPAEKT